MWRLAVAAALGCAGCAQLFGIKETSGGAHDASGAATLAVTRISVGGSIVMAPQDLTGQTATFYLPETDPTILDPLTTTLSGNTWSTDTTGIPSVVFTLPDYPMQVTHGLALPSSAQQLGYFVFEHPGATAAAPSAMVTVQGTLQTPFTASDALVFYAVGAWSALTLTGAVPGGVGTTAVNTTFAYSSASSVSGRPLEKFTSADRVLMLRYQGATLVGAGEAAPLDQSDTSTTVIYNTIADVAADTTASLPIDQTTIGQRFAAAQPATANPTMSWNVNASVAPGLGQGPELQAGTVAATDTAIALAFGNPFATSHSWGSALQVVSSATRTFTPASPALPATLSAQLLQMVDPGTSPSLDFPAGLPTAITVNGTLLTSDGATVTVDPAKAVSVSFLADRQANTLYQLQLLKLVPNAGMTAFDLPLQFEMVGATPTFSLPAALFPSGMYTLRAICYAGGYPGATAGDLTMRTLPVAAGFLDSGVFTVP